VEAGFELADKLVLMDQGPLASTLLRWMARHGAHLPFDPGRFEPSLVEEYNRAVSELADPDETVSTSTTWEWPQEFEIDSEGSVQATGPSHVGPVLVALEGTDPEEAGGSVSLSPGTHSLVLFAEGFEPANVIREVLPGVTTVLNPELIPVLPPEVRTAVAEKLVRITFSQGGRDVCRNGFLAGYEGFVLTSLSAVENVASLRVDAFNIQESFPEVPILATDTVRNLAVLQIPTDRGLSIPAASTATADQFVWAVHFPGCSDLTSTRTRLATWPTSPTSMAQVAIPLPADAAGSPLVNREGSLLGLVSNPEDIVPLILTQDVLDRARQQAAAQRAGQRISQESDSGGGVPWKWVGVGAGAAAAGVVFALTQGGSEEKPPPPTRGAIRIHWPSGG
jgi:hypothetical protein